MAETQFPPFILIAPSLEAACKEDLTGCVAVVTPCGAERGRGVTADYLVVLGSMFNHPKLGVLLVEVAPCFRTSGATHG